MNLSDQESIILLFTVLFLVMVGLIVVEKWNKRIKGDFMYLSEFAEHRRVYTRVKPKSRKIKKLLKEHEEITLVIPDVVMSITPRFFEDLFRDSVLELGKDEFKRRVNIVTMGYAFERNYNEALTRIERKREYEFVL